MEMGSGLVSQHDYKYFFSRSVSEGLFEAVLGTYLH